MARARRQRAAKRARLLRSGITRDPKDFAWLVEKTDRINIVAEGDSWFAYPKRFLVFGPRANIIDWVAKSVNDTQTANLLRLASSGDEAINMISDRQKHELAEILKRNDVHLLLFSGGGNDVVGKWDMERLLVKFEPGFTAEACIDQPRLRRKLKRIELAYSELLELRNEYASDAVVIGHSYDYLKPNKQGAEFLWGLIRTKPWIQPYMETKEIPERLQPRIIAIMLEALRDCLKALEDTRLARGKFKLVGTMGTLRFGDRRDWLNEMHPTSGGFKQIARKIYAEMQNHAPGLPAFTR